MESQTKHGLSREGCHQQGITRNQRCLRLILMSFPALITCAQHHRKSVCEIPARVDLALMGCRKGEEL